MPRISLVPWIELRKTPAGWVVGKSGNGGEGTMFLTFTEEGGLLPASAPIFAESREAVVSMLAALARDVQLQATFRLMRKGNFQVSYTPLAIGVIIQREAEKDSPENWV